MVYAVGIEILRHVLETAYPPLTVVLKHSFPVIGGESPVLSIHGEIIWRRSCLSVQIEVFRLHPYITAIAVHADGDISLQNDTVLAGMLMD